MSQPTSAVGLKIVLGPYVLFILALVMFPGLSMNTAIYLNLHGMDVRYFLTGAISALAILNAT